MKCKIRVGRFNITLTNGRTVQVNTTREGHVKKAIQLPVGVVKASDVIKLLACVGKSQFGGLHLPIKLNLELAGRIGVGFPVLEGIGIEFLI